MDILNVSCPFCGFSRQIPCDKVPNGPRRVTCTKCKESFIYTRPAGSPVTEAVHSAPIALEALAPPQTRQPAGGEPEITAPGPTAHRLRPSSRGMTDVGELFQESWMLFKRRFTALTGLCLLAMIGFVAPLLLSGGLASMSTAGGIAFASMMALGVLGGILCGSWCFGGFLFAVVDDGLTIKEALQKGKQVILPLAWVSLLSGFIVCGGYLFLIIPGIIFSVWFVFGQFVLVKERISGMGALLKSREYVRGMWFSVAIRLLLIWTIPGMVSAIPLAGPFLSLSLFPYIMICHYLIFCDLRELKGDIDFPGGIWNKLVWPAVALFGLVVVPAFLISLAGFPLTGALSHLPQSAKGKIMQEDLGQMTIPPQFKPQVPATSAEGESTGAGPASPSDNLNAFSPNDDYPESLSVFIYAANYTGEIKANGKVIQKLAGEPDRQYNYNLNGRGFRYGQNRTEVTFAEIPNPPSTMLEISMRISRHLPDGSKVVLGEWQINDKGTGSKTFDFVIPK